MTLIGVIYRDGAAEGKNDLEASRWFRLASNLGDPQAAYELGALLLDGAKACRRTGTRAKAQFERAAAQNQPAALYNLGVMALDASNGREAGLCRSGAIFPQVRQRRRRRRGLFLRRHAARGQRRAAEPRRERTWLKRASDAGVIAGQVEYAIMLFNGEGVPKDEAEGGRHPPQSRRPRAIRSPRTASRISTSTAWWCGRDLGQAAAWNAFAKAGGLQDQGLDVATANLTPDERSRFTRIVRGTIGN